MLPGKKNKTTISILDRLKQQGVPTAPLGEFDAEPGYSESGDSITESFDLAGELQKPKKRPRPKAFPAAGADEESY